jgi:hypothetical protein
LVSWLALILSDSARFKVDLVLLGTGDLTCRSDLIAGSL